MNLLNPITPAIERLENGARGARRDARQARLDWLYENATNADRRAEALEFAADWLRRLIELEGKE